MMVGSYEQCSKTQQTRKSTRPITRDRRENGYKLKKSKIQTKQVLIVPDLNRVLSSTRPQLGTEYSPSYKTEFQVYFGY